MLTALIFLASTASSLDRSSEIWSLCLQTKVALNAREEPDDFVLVAVAFSHCARFEPAVRKWILRSLIVRTGSAATAEKHTDLAFAALKVEQTEFLLSRSRSAHDALGPKLQATKD